MNLLAPVDYNCAMNTHNYVNFFRQTSPYIHAHRGKTFVIAISGESILAPNFHSMIHDIALLQSLGMRVYWFMVRGHKLMSAFICLE